VTGAEPSSSTVKSMVGSFKAVKAYADFGDAPIEDRTGQGLAISPREEVAAQDGVAVPIRFGYTINLNLPATSDIAVFDAIFKSLRDHLL
jgi:hypothetical protein